MPTQSKRRLSLMSPVEAMIGKIAPVAKKTNTDGDAGKVVVGFIRKTRLGVNRFAIKTYGNVYLTAATKQAARVRGAKFKSVSQAVPERLQNPTYRAMDEEQFHGQTSYKTLRGFVFKKCWDAYEG